MNTLKNDITVTLLTDALTAVVKEMSGRWSPFMRLQLNPSVHGGSSPEILYLDSQQQLSFLPRAEYNPASAAKIVALARKLADDIPRHPKMSSSPWRLKLEAEEIDGRWLVNITVHTLLAPDFEAESTYRFRTRYAPRNPVRSAA